MNFTEKYLRSKNSFGLVHHNTMYQYMQYFDQQMTIILQKRPDYTKKCKVLAKKACTLQRVCAIFIDGKPVAHGRAEMVGIAQPEALCGRDKFHSD